MLIVFICLQFLRMQGKRKRGDPEMIDIIDVNEADHITDAAKFRQKFSTEELSYKPEVQTWLRFTVYDDISITKSYALQLIVLYVYVTTWGTG